MTNYHNSQTYFRRNFTRDLWRLKPIRYPKIWSQDKFERSRVKVDRSLDGQT